MIKRLKRRILLIITLSLSVIIAGITFYYSFQTYRETVNSSGVMIERFIGDRPDDKGRPSDMKEDTPPEEENRTDIEGVYRFSVDSEGNVSGTTEDETLIEYAKAAYQKNGETGIVDEYIYRKMSMKNNGGANEITLIESTDTINRLNRNIAISVIIGVSAIVLIYFIAKKITKSIVKPVEESFEMQKQFISDASHELKTPLAVIEANTGVLEAEIGESKWINYIHNEIESMNKLVNDLLLLAKTEGADTDNVAAFDLSRTVEINASGFEGMAFEKGVSLNYELPEDITFKGDKEDIKRIISTLVDNAIKHTEKGGDIWVCLSKEKGEYLIKVKNRGEPIPEEEKSRIFERFYRVDKVRNREEKRYGLGLAIAKQAAEKYKGEISVNCDNGITVFTVKLYSM